MFSFLKSKKYKPTTVKSTYYIRECLIHTSEDLIKILNPKKGGDTIEEKVRDEIKFKDLPLLNLSEKMIINAMENPVYIHDNSEVIKGHRVLFYKEDVEFYRFLIQFHFIYNDFFFVSNKVSSSGMLSNNEKSKIVNQLKRKYLSDKPQKGDSFLLNLEDKNGSVLNTIDDVYFYVNYLSGIELTNKLKQRYSDFNADNPKPAFDESIDKYF
ncbi:MAG: hypothetical protein GXO88_13040 [Chlorobi bacterium]|nr:hypothetical protein [Chlorobiota bacterium]